MEKYLTPNQVASILQVDVATVRKWLRSGKLKGFKLSPKIWRISEVALKSLTKE